MTDWTFGGVRIYTQQQSESEKKLSARLNTVGGATVLHEFGHDDPIMKLEVLVLTSGDYGVLKTYSAFDAPSYELISPEGTLGAWFLNSIDGKRHDSTWHKFFDRPSLDTNEPLYVISLDLYIDDGT